MTDWQTIGEHVLGFSPVDPVVLVGLLIAALACVELRRCIRAGWHRPEEWRSATQRRSG